MKKIFLILVVTPAYMMAGAQYVADYLKAADTYYKKGDYYSAAQYYEKWLTANKPKGTQADYNPYAVKTGSGVSSAAAGPQQVVYNLAESYRKLNYPVKAVAYYEKALSYNNEHHPLAAYYYAVTLRSLGKDEEAEKAFQLFLDKYKTDDVYGQSARSEVLNLHFIREQLRRKDLKLFTVQKQNTAINPSGANYSPVWLNNTTLLFTSTRPEGTDKNQPFINRIYSAAVAGDSFTAVTNFGLAQPANVHQGAMSCTPDGNTLFLTRWTVAAAGKKTSAIYVSRKVNNAWTEPVLVDALVNTPGANTQQPFVMPGGKYLLYASDKAGGYGGFDLWYAEIDAHGKPVRTANLGNTVNTATDEQAPYFHEASGTLVFSCNGRTGMGGFDFFFSKGTVDKFTTPENFGYPVNSVKDDIYFTSKGPANNILADVLLSSDRSADCCLELFSLNKKKPLKQISGLVVVCGEQTILSGVSVNIIDTISNKTIYSAATAADGSYAFEMEAYQPLKAVATLNGYKDGSLQFNAPVEGTEKDSLTNPAICLVKEAPGVEEIVVIDNIYYDFDSSKVRADSYASLDKIVNMLNQYPAMEIEIRAHTDNKGSDAYNKKLSDARAYSVVTYLVSKGIAQNRLQFKGYGAAMPVAPNQLEDGSDNADGRQQNRRTEFKVLKK